MTVHGSFHAFMANPDTPKPDNPIHSTDGGKKHGFRGALIGGIHVYGWTTSTFISCLGEAWLDSGWAEVSFKKPSYDGDEMAVTVATKKGGEFKVTNQEGDLCLKGEVGNGEAPWFDSLKATRFTKTLPSPDSRPELSLETAPVGRNLIPMSVPFSKEEHALYLQEKLGETEGVYQGDNPRCHPSWLAGQLIYLLHHSYVYGPAIHTQSHIQHLAPAYAGQTFTVTGFCQEAYERNGHHYIVNDGSIWSEAGVELARIRHTAIFRLRTA